MFELFAARLIRRFGSGAVATFMIVVLGICIASTACMPEPFLFALALLAAGGADAMADVSQNAHGLWVQDAYNRSVLNSFHALWSLGSVLGGLMAAAALFPEIALGTHLMISAVLFGGTALVAWTLTLPPEPQPPEPESDTEQCREDARLEHLKRVQRVALRTPSTLLVLGALVLMAMTGAVVEDAGNSWSALYLSEYLGAPSSVAALGFTGLVAGQLRIVLSIDLAKAESCAPGERSSL